MKTKTGVCINTIEEAREYLRNRKTESREEKIARLESLGMLDPNCSGCKVWYAHPEVNPFAPSHKPSTKCQSGSRPHCTCGTCF